MVNDMPTRHETVDLTGMGRFIRERRSALQLTQVQLAEQLSWTQERISVLERGKYGMPSFGSGHSSIRKRGCGVTGFATETAPIRCPSSGKFGQRTASSDHP
jgi:hypothetical protein